MEDLIENQMHGIFINIENAKYKVKSLYLLSGAVMDVIL